MVSYQMKILRHFSQLWYTKQVLHIDFSVCKIIQQYLKNIDAANKRLEEFKMNTTKDDLRFLKGNLPSSLLKKRNIKKELSGE